MKVSCKGFLGLNHSWSIVSQNICRQLISMGHEVDMYSTNGPQYFPDDLKPYLKACILESYTPQELMLAESKMQSQYEMQVTYTSLKNFPNYLNRGAKNRFGIWTYEFAGKNSLPVGFAKNYKYCDHLLPPSQFAKQVFMDSGIPESHMTVIPHGIDAEHITQAVPFKLKTNKKNKIFINVAQVHRRKNLEGALEMYGKAFDKKDDVCLVIKVQDKKPSQVFELNFNEILNDFKFKYKNHAEIEVVKEFIPNIYSLYKSCDIMFSASHTEAFGMTALEAQATGLINIAPRYGGFLDFMNDDNSLLIEGKEFYVKPNMVYWSYQSGSKAFMPDINSGVEMLVKSVKDKEMLKAKAESLVPEVLINYSWKSVVQRILELVK